MKPQDRPEKTRTEPSPERHEPAERKVGPPIEREHETQKGVFEEEEQKEHKKPERR